MKALVKVLAVLIAVGVVAAPASAVLRNVGPQIPPTFSGHQLTPATPHTGERMLYAPSEADDPAYRALIAAAIGGGAVVDYYDARNGTPDATLLSQYDCVHTWANYAYFDNVGFGDNLADFVDNGGTVILGAFCTYCFGNFLSGRIMTPAYCGVYSPNCSNHFTQDAWDGTGDCCDYDGVTSWQAFYRDYLAVQGDGTVCGNFIDREIAVGLSPVAVHYVNGSGGAPILVDNNIATVVANACACQGDPTPVQESTWGAVKSLYR